MHSVDGDAKLFVGKGSNVIGTLFGETGPPVDALKLNVVAHVGVPFFEISWR